MAKLIGFKDLNRNSPYSTADEHANILFTKGKVLWGQWSMTGHKDDLSLSAYQAMNNSGRGCIVYAYDRSSMLLKLKVDRVLFTPEVLDEHLEEYIPNYYGIQQPVHYYLEISDITTADVSQASRLINSNTLRQVHTYSSIRGINPWNVNEIEIEGNELIEPKHIITAQNQLRAITQNLHLQPSITIPKEQKTYSVYRIYHKDTINHPDDQYIGETNDVQRRWEEHCNPKNYLNRNTMNRHLYIVMHHEHYENFACEILETDIPTELEAREREAYWIEQYDSYIWGHGLNSRDERKFLRK